MEHYTLIFKHTTERTLAVPVHAEDYDDAMERGLKMLHASKANPDLLGRQTRERWGPATSEIIIESIE